MREICPTCGGLGYIWIATSTASPYQITCHACLGSGRVWLEDVSAGVVYGTSTDRGYM